MEKGKIKIYCFFQIDEYIQIFTLTDEEEKEYWDVMNSDDYEYGDEYDIADKVLLSRNVFTQDPQLSYIITDSVAVIDDKEKIIVRL